MYNHVELIGRLVRDCETSKTKNTGQSVCNFAVATNEHGRNANGEKTDITTYIDCTAWRHDADFLGVYGKQGRLLHVVGRIRKNSYMDKDGIKRYTTTVEATSVNMLDKPEKPLETHFKPVYEEPDTTEDELPW